MDLRVISRNVGPSYRDEWAASRATSFHPATLGSLAECSFGLRPERADAWLELGAVKLTGEPLDYQGNYQK